MSDEKDNDHEACRYLSDKAIKMKATTTAEVSYLMALNVTGLTDEHGFRLYWTSDGRYLTPALGYATSLPFTTQREAVAYGLRVLAEKAKRSGPGKRDEGS